MKVMVHYPVTPDDCRELQEKVAKVHAAAVLRSITKLPCTKKDKLDLLDAVIKQVRVNT